ncbi:MAG: transporter substrate-binding domain-containing protein [Methylacidiphilales bacterium]|nr:transporter substrate-binding domain-containing protein [Candidatus Methylacidiphilales bacterium]
MFFSVAGLGRMEAVEPVATFVPWSGPIGFSEQEKAWLQAHPVIRVGIDPLWPPFSLRNSSNQYEGIDIDLLRSLERRLNVCFDILPANTWGEVYEKARAGGVDVLVGTAWSPERERFLRFTQPYLSFPVAIITRLDAPFLTGLGDLQGKVVASPRSYITTDFLERDYPRCRLSYTDTVDEAMRLVVRGHADAVVTNLANASYVIRTSGYTNLKIAGITPYNFDLRYGVRRDWPELAVILDKALATINASERQNLLDRWIHVEYERSIVWRNIGKGLLIGFGAGLFILALILIWNRKMAAEIERRRRVETELEQARKRLELLNEEKSNLMSMAAHDLKNPLTGIVMGLELLHGQQNPSPESVRRASSEALKLASRMDHLVRQLLSVNQIEQEYRSYRTNEAVDLTPLLEEVLESYKNQLVAKQIQLEIPRPIRPLQARVDHNAFQQIADNLISNAIKFTPPGGRVTVGLEPGDKGSVVLRVADNGPGFAPGDQTKLFEKFARLTARPTGGESSTGLGLSIVKSLVTAMGGSISCRSERGHGAEFTVELPGLV